MTNFQGGTRVNAFVSGGYLQAAAPKRIGTKLEGLLHIADFYATFAFLAGEDPTDHRAAAAKLPPIDSLNLWPYLSGQNDTSPRTDIYMDTTALLVFPWKLITGSNQGDCWASPSYPNGTSDPACYSSLHCHHGCLFNVQEDPSEYTDLASVHPDVSGLRSQSGCARGGTS
jgi:arylsulfatase I/J